MDQADFRFFGFADLDYGLVTLDGTYNVQLTITMATLEGGSA